MSVEKHKGTKKEQVSKQKERRKPIGTTPYGATVSIGEKQNYGHAIYLNGKEVGHTDFYDNWIEIIYLEYEWQKQGIGTVVYQHIEKLMQQQGYKKIRIESEHTALPFWWKLGFHTTTISKEEISPELGGVYAMEKVLK
jgi:GNAT superfamily N-acetyltransferase